MKNIIKKITTLLLLFVVLGLLTGVIKGKDGKMYQSRQLSNKAVGSPFESSGSTSRYALVEGIVENKTIFFDDYQFKFARPDVVEHAGKYFSIFTPGVSLVSVPFYLLGRNLGFPQIFSYLSTTSFALINVVLILRISRKLNVSILASILAGLIFLFATNSLSYALTLTQHQLSTALILSGILISLSKSSIWRNIFFGFIYGASLLVDIPNGLLLLPALIYLISKNIKIKEYKLDINFRVSFLTFGLIPMIIIFASYDFTTTGSYYRVGQLLGRVNNENKTVPEIASESKRSLNLPFNTRNQLNGYYVLTVSNERGFVFYSPVLVLSFVGVFVVYKKKKKREELSLLSSIFLMDLTVYSLFGDVYGGWAFGPRYLIPGAAILSVGVAAAIEKYNKNFLFTLMFVILLTYSVLINVMGAMTTTQVPPKVEAINLSEPIPYTYKYNWQQMNKGLNSSLFYNLFLSGKISSREYIFIYTAMVLVLIYVIYVTSYWDERRKGIK